MAVNFKIRSSRTSSWLYFVVKRNLSYKTCPEYC